MVATISDPTSRPVAVEAGTAAVYRPRFPVGAYSARKVLAPAYSPDAEKPCTMRSSNRPIGARMPTISWEGRQPIRKDDPDMMRIDQDSAHRRPLRSPSEPQMMPPMGRRMNDSAKIAKVCSIAVVLLAWGKKTTAMTVAR